MTDLEQRLAAAAAALREHDILSERGRDLLSRIRIANDDVSNLTHRYAREQADVADLEGFSLTRIFASLRGDHADALARERAEADAAQYRLAEARKRMEAMRSEQETISARLRQLANAPGDYERLLDEKEHYLRTQGGPPAEQLLALATQRGRLAAQLKEVAEAQLAADRALEALHAVRDRLGSAGSWSTYDTFFGGGVIGSHMKHSRLDEAAAAASVADQRLAVLRTELADVGVTDARALQLSISNGTRLVDVWLDNIFTDMMVRDRIKDAQHNVASLITTVVGVRQRLAVQAQQDHASLAQTEAERRALLG